MNAAQRRVYFTQVWPAACAAQGWSPKDDAMRRQCTATAMRLCGCAGITSASQLNSAQVTALFCYLKHLARPMDLRLLSDWDDCQKDYISYNRTLQAGYWRTRAGYRKGGRIDRQRFEGRPSGGIYDSSKMTKEEADQYLMTMRARAKAKARRDQQSDNIPY